MVPVPFGDALHTRMPMHTEEPARGARERKKKENKNETSVVPRRRHSVTNRNTESHSEVMREHICV